MLCHRCGLTSGRQACEPDLAPVKPALERPQPEVDARGLRCPLPVIRLAEVARDAPPGTNISVLASDPAARHDIPAWCRMRHHELLEVSEVFETAVDGGRTSESAHPDSAHPDSAHPDRGTQPAYLRFVVRILAQPANEAGSGSGSERSSRAT